MNREIKFRVRRLDTNTLVAYEFLTETGWAYKLANNLHGCNWDDAPTYEGVFHPSQFQATYKCQREQYTGLKDKNRKDIYDRDILAGVRQGSNSDKTYTGVIEWNTQQAGWIMRCGKYVMEILSLAMDGDGIETRLSSFEVIGNIHENPDLLK